MSPASASCDEREFCPPCSTEPSGKVTNKALESQRNAESMCPSACLKAGSPRAIRDIMKVDEWSAEDFKGFNCFLPNSTADNSPLPPSQSSGSTGVSAAWWGLGLARAAQREHRPRCEH